MIQHFPIRSPVFEHQFGIAALGTSQRVISASGDYSTEIQLRRRLLRSQHQATYLCAPYEHLTSIRCAIDWLLQQAEFIKRRNDHWANEITGDEVADDSLCLQWIGENLREDIAIVSARPGFPLLAGCVCFPSGWSIGEKAGQSLLEVHAPVPEFARQLYPATQRLMNRLKTGKTVWRTNWGLRPWSQLDQSPRHKQQLDQFVRRVTGINAGDSCFFRVEFQTLTRLQCGDVLFTIRTEQCALSELDLSQQQLLLGTLQTCPVETLKYKGIMPVHEPVIEYLVKRCQL